MFCKSKICSLRRLHGPINWLLAWLWALIFWVNAYNTSCKSVTAQLNNTWAHLAHNLQHSFTADDISVRAPLSPEGGDDLLVLTLADLSDFMLWLGPSASSIIRKKHEHETLKFCCRLVVSRLRFSEFCEFLVGCRSAVPCADLFCWFCSLLPLSVPVLPEIGMLECKN